MKCTQFIFATVYYHTRTTGTLGFVAVMSQGKVCYDPKHPAAFRSVANLVKASKNKRRNYRPHVWTLDIRVKVGRYKEGHERKKH